MKFSEAIKLKLLSDYQVVILGFKDVNYLKMFNKRNLINLTNGLKTDVGTLASHLSVIKSIKKYNLRKIISFHSRVKSAKDFADKLPKVVQWMSTDSQPDGELITNYVSGVMPTSERNKNLRALSNIEGNQRYVLSNAPFVSLAD